MQHVPVIVISLMLGPAGALAQSGRRNTNPPPTPPPPQIEEPKERPAKPPGPERPEVVAVPNEEYKCVDDGSLVVVSSNEAEKVFAPNEVTIKAKLLSRPKPEYTPEARHRAVEGVIAVRVVVLKNGSVSTVKITGRGGPFGLNESAIQAACKMEFVPASKDGERVSQWFKTEIVFRLASSIGR